MIDFASWIFYFVKNEFETPIVWIHGRYRVMNDATFKFAFKKSHEGVLEIVRAFFSPASLPLLWLQFLDSRRDRVLAWILLLKEVVWRVSRLQETPSFAGQSLLFWHPIFHTWTVTHFPWKARTSSQSMKKLKRFNLNKKRIHNRWPLSNYRRRFPASKVAHVQLRDRDFWNWELSNRLLMHPMESSNSCPIDQELFTTNH